MIEFKVPHMGLTMDELTIIEWRCAIGDQVTEGQTLVELEADKANTEVESPAAGVVAELLASAGDQVAPGQVIARLRPL